MSRYLFLISYICDNQVGHCQLDNAGENLSVEQARDYLQGLFRGEACSFRNVQVQPVQPLDPLVMSSQGDPIEFFSHGSAPLGEC